MSLLALLTLLVGSAGLIGIVIGLPCGPGCLTCGCLVGSDDFDRDDGEPGSNWYVWAGNWAVSANLLFTGEADSIIQFQHARSSSLGQHVTVDLAEIGSAADLPRVYVDLVDGDNFHFVEFDTGAMTFAFYRRVEGVDTLLETIEYDTTLTTIDVCFTGGDFQVAAGGDSWKVASMVVHNGSYVGLGCGALSGYVAFDDFVFQQVSDKCPGCPCEICLDSFDRAVLDDGSPCGCTVFSGTWDTSGGTARCTSAGIMAFNTPHPDGYSTMIVETYFKHSNSGSTCDVIVALVDSTHYYYARYTPGTNTVAIWRKDGLSENPLPQDVPTVAMTPDVWYQARVCVSPNGTIVASLDGVPVVKVVGASPSGTYAGLGASGSGTATFDNFRFEKFCEPCPTPCNALTGCYEYDFDMEVVISGVTNVEEPFCTESDCGDWNTTYIVPWARSWMPIPGSWFQCYWIMDTPEPLCGPFPDGSRIRVEFNYLPATDTSNCEVILYSEGLGSSSIVFHLSQAGTFNCADIINLDVPYAHGGGDNCDGTSATCRVTLL